MNTNKRQKAASICEQRKDTQAAVQQESYQCRTLDTLPPEILEFIFRHLPLDEVAGTVRLVSRRCLEVAAIVLNAAFLAVGTRLEITMKSVEDMLPKAKSKSELLAYSKAFNVLELIRSQYRMLRAVTWRYTHPPKKNKFPRLCFYAGVLLDEMNTYLRNATTNPISWVQNPNRISIGWFVSLCKRFMNYFEKLSERKINRSALMSGCKAVDILDCLTEGRQVLSFKISSGNGTKDGIVSMRLRYVMKRAWFTCLEVPNSADENSWRDEQRFMYLRLRRLVGSVNEHLLEKLHYERELLLGAPSMVAPRPPPASTYSGYGEYGGQFFYYGNMNKYAYESKFKVPERGEWEDARGETEEEIRGTPSFDLVIAVELKCSPELAPLAVKPILKSDDIENRNAQTYSRQELYLRLDVACPASKANRLPATFTWEIKNPRRGRYASTFRSSSS